MGFSEKSVIFQSKVKVRRASISEPSDTDHVPRRISSTQGAPLYTYLQLLDV